MTRNRLIGVLVVAILILGSSIGGAACGKSSSSSVVGKYVNQNSPPDYMELKSNGEYYMEEDGESYQGRWSVSGDKITLTWTVFQATGTIRGGRIIDDDGEVWVKK